MNKEEFLKALAALLSDIPEEECREVLQYYQDYIEEAGPERETEIIKGIGSPERIAAEIRASLDGAADTGEFTEHGYQDSRFEEAPHVPDHYAEIVSGEVIDDEDGGAGSGKSAGRRAGASGWSWERNSRRTGGRSSGWSWEKNGRQESQSGRASGWSWERNSSRAKRSSESSAWEEGANRGDAHTREHEESSQTRRRNGLILVILFICFGIPIMKLIIGAGFSIIGAVIGGVFGIFGGLFGLVIGMIGLTVELILSGVKLIFLACLTGSPAGHLAMASMGFLKLAAAMLLLAVCKWVCSKIPGIIRFCVETVGGLIRWIVNAAQGFFAGLFGRRGGADQ